MQEVKARYWVYAVTQYKGGSVKAQLRIVEPDIPEDMSDEAYEKLMAETQGFVFSQSPTVELNEDILQPGREVEIVIRW